MGHTHCMARVFRLQRRSAPGHYSGTSCCTGSRTGKVTTLKWLFVARDDDNPYAPFQKRKTANQFTVQLLMPSETLFQLYDSVLGTLMAYANNWRHVSTPVKAASRPCDCRRSYPTSVSFTQVLVLYLFVSRNQQPSLRVLDPICTDMFHPKEMTKMKTLRALAAPIASAACALALVTSASATELKMLTEDYAPLNFERDGQIVGIATDQVVEMMARAGVDYDMELT